MRGRVWLATTAAVAVVIGLGLQTISDDPGRSDAAGTAGSDDGAGLQTAEVRRGQLSSEREFKASVSFGDRWAVNTAATGTLTSHRDVGKVVRPGDELVRVDDHPLFLAHGAMPMYRELHKVNTGGRDQYGNRLKRQRGADVLQLQAYLIEGGYDDGEGLDSDAEFGTKTEDAVEAWQEDVGLPVTGRVDSSQIVFSPELLRIAAEVRVGAPFTGLEVNHAEASVLIDTSNRDRGALDVGTDVTVTLPDGSELPGSVVEQEQVTAADGSTVWRSTVEVVGQLPGDASTAEVSVLDVVAEDALIVPVGALLALAEGGFAVELVTEDGTHLVAVEVDDVVDGQAAITVATSGAVDVGDDVVVPS